MHNGENWVDFVWIGGDPKNLYMNNNKKYVFLTYVGRGGNNFNINIKSKIQAWVGGTDKKIYMRFYGK